MLNVKIRIERVEPKSARFDALPIGTLFTHMPRYFNAPDVFLKVREPVGEPERDRGCSIDLHGRHMYTGVDAKCYPLEGELTLRLKGDGT